MNCKTISFVQVNYQQGPIEDNSFYLPYSIGSIASYAFKFAEISKNYKLGDIIFKRESIKDLAEKLSKSDIIGFSTYVWNKNYNYQLAKEIKKINPSVITIFGGPEIPIKQLNIFKKYPFMDIVVKKEGELIFKNLLKNYHDLKSVKGLLINEFGNVIDTGNDERIDNLDDLPSPYLNGIFDKIIEDNPGIEWAATLETNRGCPYQCTFCDWGSLTYSKVKKFNLDRVFKEIEWMGMNRCGFVFVADANFGIFPERDNLIIDKILEVQKKYNYPKNFTITWAKNQKKEVVEMVSKLVKSNYKNNGLTISVQSLNDNVLSIIKRKNLNQHKIEEIFKLCEENNVPLNTEIILGLPGETLESWKDTIWQLFESGNHTGVDITQVELLENAEMNLVQKEIYEMNSIPVFDYLGKDNSGIPESIEVVNSTKDMPLQDMIDAQFFNCFINTFHISGLTVVLSRFLRKYKNVSYKDFYQTLYNEFKKDQWFLDKELQIKNLYKEWMTKGNFSYALKDIDVNGYNLIYLLLFFIHIESKQDHIYKTVENSLKSYQVDNLILENILKFQKLYIANYKNLKNQLLIEEFDFDILKFIVSNNTEIVFQKSKFKFSFNEDTNISFRKFLELLYFGRRKNFGRLTVEKL